ncbi:MarR family winged helix-turn-helix transcriptional regulator [Lysobacter niastensis]|uniref:Winged helix-turn-helix transcriptional regulator n=1 Tax=Lysobacter niastensis TaxID=380629 RepID=A0ABS0B526_9GAMM|nr:MarR family winged helix-turn-helix transcriptional regulator [Lysobacter niastensis]MBF6023859.1 winged helix-turn-helix transcriptional regulator [Lysobacter niastensis]
MTTPTPYTGTCTCFRLRKLSRLMSQRYDRELAPAGVNINQYSILRRASARPRAIGDLSRELGMDRTTLSRDLKPLAAAGWVEMVSGEDARQRLVQITAKGHRVIAKAQPLWRKAQDAIDAGLGKTHVETLHAHLDRAMQQLDDGDDE